MAEAAHLVKRFFTSLLPIGPTRDDDRWARSQLTEGEIGIWDRMSPQDRRHAVGVAHRTEAALGDEAIRPVIAAALLHDCGKTVSGFGTLLRVVATVGALTLGRERIIGAGRGRRGLRRRFADYLEHDRLGAELLGEAGSAPLTVAWAGEHHLPADRWSVPVEIGEALRDADDD